MNGYTVKCSRCDAYVPEDEISDCPHCDMSDLCSKCLVCSEHSCPDDPDRIHLDDD